MTEKGCWLLSCLWQYSSFDFLARRQGSQRPQCG